MLGFTILRHSKAEQLLGCQDDVQTLFKFLLETYGAGISHSQFGQDIFAWLVNGMKRDGYFVEFGATNGKSLSNSYLLEKEFGWRGIVAEPGRTWHRDLQINRTCAIELDCVWKTTGDTLEFNMLEEGELSTLTEFNRSDGRRRDRKKGETYMVQTISLADMLEKHGAPPVIDYLSIDTEGSEFEILRAFDFSKYRFNVITCEHNYAPIRDDICKLLESHGYQRVLPHLSQCDDWYIMR